MVHRLQRPAVPVDDDHGDGADGHGHGHGNGHGHQSWLKRLT